jgi:hypothetical protein
VRIPTFSRHSDSDTDEPTTVASGSNAAPVQSRHTRDDEPTLTDGRAVREDDRNVITRDNRSAAAVRDERAAANRDANVTAPVRTREERIAEEKTPVVAGPRPRASLLATLGLILGVVGALLVLSGPLLGYGIGVSVLALILSLAGISATGKRHVAGRLDAVIGMLLALAAIVVGVLALTGSLSWLGTDMHPVDSVRHWLDVNTVNRF